MPKGSRTPMTFLEEKYNFRYIIGTYIHTQYIHFCVHFS
jgi:hypothetical protein